MATMRCVPRLGTIPVPQKRLIREELGVVEWRWHRGGGREGFLEEKEPGKPFCSALHSLGQAARPWGSCHGVASSRRPSLF